MKNTPAQSATSLPRAPREDEHGRMVKYFTMMAIRVACFVLMVVVQPYSWYTWLFAVGAIFLPYVAVVVANVAAAPAGRAVPPERGITARPEPAPDEPAAGGVIRLHESPSAVPPAAAAPGAAEAPRSPEDGS